MTMKPFAVDVEILECNFKSATHTGRNTTLSFHGGKTADELRNEQPQVWEGATNPDDNSNQ